MLQTYQFAETTPNAPGTVASSKPVTGSLGLAGVCADLSQWSALSIEANLIGATGGTLDIFIQYNPSGDRLNWIDYGHFGQLAAGAGALKQVVSVSTGAQNTTLATVGFNLSPALAASTFPGGAWADAFRLVFVAGAGTSAGAAITINITGQRAINESRGAFSS